MSPTRSRWLRMGRVAGLLGLIGSLVVPSPARAATTCVYNPAKRIVTVSGNEDIVMVRSGNDIVTHPSPSGPSTPCMDAGATTTATVHNTDLVKVSLTSAFFGLDQIQGPLEPGFTNEPGASDEIEISFNLGALFVRGTTGRDRIVLGRDGVNLNAGESEDDVDVTGITALPQLFGDDGNDLITLRGGSATGPGVDPEITIFGGEGNDTILAYHEPLGDVLIPIGAHMTINGGGGRDHIEGSAWEDDIAGGPGDDYVDGGESVDAMDGEDGDNTVAFKLEKRPVEVDLDTNSARPGDELESIPGFSNVVGSDLDDRLEGDTAPNQLRGGGGSDVLVGEAGVDVLTGQGGDDLFHAQAESETLSGGAGVDTVTYFSDVMNEIDLATGQSSGPGGGDTLASMENVSADGPVTVIGDAKANEIQVSPGAANVFAGGGADRIETGSAADTLRGQGGADYFRAGSGGGSQIGGPGGDEFTTSPGDDSFIGGPGRDLVTYQLTPAPVDVDLRIAGPQPTGAGMDSLAGIEDLLGSFRGDTLTGDSNANRLDGFLGDDLIVAGGGNDTVTGWQGEDDLLGGAGRDVLSFADASGAIAVDLATTQRQDTGLGWDTIDQFESVIGSAFNDLVKGDAGPNRISGGAGHDRLSGRGGPDRLSGQAGNDDLYGGAGADSCFGGPGVDTLHSC